MLFLILAFYCTFRENLEAQSSKYWHCQLQCFTIMCYYTPHSDPFLPLDKIGMLPLELMEIHGFLLVFFSKCLLLMSACISWKLIYSLEIGWSLCPWTTGNRWEVRQEMIEWVDNPTEKTWLRHKACLGFAYWPHSLLELFMSITTWELCFLLLPVSR